MNGSNRLVTVSLITICGLLAACSGKPSTGPAAATATPAAAAAPAVAAGTAAATTVSPAYPRSPDAPEPVAGPDHAADRRTIAALKQLVSADPPPDSASGAAAPGAHPASPPLGALPTAGGPLTVADVRITPPESWRFVHPTSQMRRAQYQIPGESGAGEAVVYFFGAGQGGGVEANIERWLAQVTPAALAAPDPRAREQREVGGVKLTLVRARGTYDAGMAMAGPQAKPLANAALVGLILESPGGPVFVKITGPAPTIDAAAPAIEQLAASVALVR